MNDFITIVFSLKMGKGHCFNFNSICSYVPYSIPDLDQDQSLSYFLHGVPECQSGHPTRKQDGSVE